MGSASLGAFGATPFHSPFHSKCDYDNGPFPLGTPWGLKTTTFAEDGEKKETAEEDNDDDELETDRQTDRQSVNQTRRYED